MNHTLPSQLPPLLLAALVSFGLGACGDDDAAPAGVDAADALPGAVDAAQAADASPSAPFSIDGVWSLENVSQTAGTISHDGAIAITQLGTLWVAYAEPDAEATHDQDIVATMKGTGGWTAEPRTTDTGIQNASPSMVADRETLHLVWHGSPGGDNDIFYSQAAGTWSERDDLTSLFETDEPRADYHPSLAQGPSGALAVAYLSAPIAPAGPPEVRVFQLQGVGAGQVPTTVVDAAVSVTACDPPSAAYDPSGKLHVVAACGPLSDFDLVYATNATGTWTTEPLTDAAADDGSPTIGVSADGGVWVTWIRDTDAGRDVYATRLDTTEHALVRVTQTPLRSEAHPRIVIDAAGRPLVAFAGANDDNYYDIFVTVSEDGGDSFVEPVNLTPGTEASDEWMLYSLILHPTTGLPHLSYQAILAGTNPLDSEVMHAELLPPE